MEISDKERLILFNQYEILKRLDKSEYKDYEIKQDILVNGFKYDYTNLVEAFSTETREEVSKFVIDVLQMHRILLSSYESLSSEQKKEIKLKDIKFRGFDGNEESDYYIYAKFILKKMERFPEIYEEGRIEINSHWNTLDRYKKMVDIWKNIKVSRYDNINFEDIKKIIK